MLKAIKNWLDPPKPLKLTAKPGLMTLLDLALYRSVEGELTASISAAHALLQVWLDLKRQAQDVLHNTYYEQQFATLTFARHCLEAACDAIEKLSTDRFASSANLSDAYESRGANSFSASVLSGHISIVESISDTGRRAPNPYQRRRDCWETARLICPDHIWADDTFLTGQRLIRLLTKEIPNTIEDRSVKTLVNLVQQDLKMRLHQFRTATETNAVVLKRLYLVKCELRAPFRAFLEAHQTVQRAPSLDLVDEYMEKDGFKNTVTKVSKRNKNNDNTSTKTSLKESSKELKRLLEDPKLIEALQIERLLESLEEKMAKGIFVFTELARLLDYKRVKPAKGKLENDKELYVLQDLFRRLRCCLCRKISPETSTGIRPLLLDLQGVSRGEVVPFSFNSKSRSSPGEGKVRQNIKTFIQKLQRITTLCQTRHGFVYEHQQRRNDNSTISNFDVPASLVKECAKFDSELWEAYCLDWFDLVRKQRKVSENFAKLSEEIRQAEMKSSIKDARGSLGLVRERLERLTKDRELRWKALQDMVEDICAREMNWEVILEEPPSDNRVLELPSTSVLGLFGLTLKMVGESLPIG